MRPATLLEAEDENPVGEREWMRNLQALHPKGPYEECGIKNPYPVVVKPRESSSTQQRRSSAGLSTEAPADSSSRTPLRPPPEIEVVEEHKAYCEDQPGFTQ